MNEYINPVAELWARHILAGLKDFNQVPEKLKDEVKKLILDKPKEASQENK